MDRNDKFKDSVFFAIGTIVVVLVVYFVQQMVGFDKMNLGATPKKFIEVIAEWPRFLGLGLMFFVGTFWWQMSQKDLSYLICPHCTETVEKGKELSIHCTKCGGQLEDLEGFYDRHPDKRTK